MTSLRTVILLLALIYSQQSPTLGIKHFSTLHEFQFNRSSAISDEVIIPRVPLNNTHLVYAIETDSKKPASGSAPTLEYTVYSETINFDYVNHVLMCTLKLKNYPKDLQVDSAQIYPLGKDKAILAWYQRKTAHAFKTDAFYKILIVKFADCKVAQTEVYMDKCSQDGDHNTRCLTELVIREDDSFEVIFANRALCEDKFCRARYSADAEVLDAPRTWLFKNHEDNKDFNAYRMTLEPIPDSQQYLLLEKNLQKMMVSLVNRHGWRNKLAEFNTTFDGYNAKLPVSCSTAHEITGFTFTDSNHTENHEFNSFGRQMDTPRTFKFSSNAKSRVLSRHNLQAGGFLALVAEYTPKNSTYFFKVARYDAKMRAMGELQLLDYQCDELERLIHSRIFHGDNQEHCVSLADFRIVKKEETTARENLEFRMFCFVENELGTTV